MAQPVDVEVGDKVMVPSDRARERDVEMDTIQTNSSDAKLSETYMRQQTGDDDVLVKKMVHVNRAINEIGWTKYHLKLFFLNGFGYAVDSMLVVCQSIAQPAIRMEFEGRGVTQLFAVSLSSAVGLLVGALVWGLSADMIGRKLAFNSSLFICALFVVIAGAMPNYIAICAMVAIYSAGAGGNYAIDATIFLEFLPWRYGFLTTILAIWWGVGYLIAGLLAWAFLPNFSCESSADCTWDNNKGWRLLHFTAGGIVLIAAVARLLIFKIEHSPKWLITQRRDAEAVEIIHGIAKKTGRPCTLTLEQLEEEGEIKGNKESLVRTTSRQIANLFSTRKQMFATACLFFLWLLIGTADPLYSTFRPYYLATRGFEDGEADPNITWRNYTLTNFAGLVGPLFAWPLLDTPYIRRRGTLAIGAALTMAFLFGFTQVTNATQNLVVSCFISAVSNIFYGALYGVTSELLPTGSRGTGYGLAVGLNRTGNIMANIIGTYADVTSTAPLFVCASLYGGLVIVSLILPFDPSGNQIG